MAWPQATDYYEAVQSAGVSFKDADLRAARPALNALGLPLPRSGNFADVYEFRSSDSQRRWAVKCFTREVQDRERRFAAISQHLKQRHLPFMVEFDYLPDGILVHGVWYPVLKMHWVDGQTLSEFVHDHLGKPQMLLGLAKIWRRLAHELRETGIAHGDLQHGNVMLIHSRAGKLGVKLIDYDGMFVPAVGRIRSGEVGHPNYQHPERLRDGIYDFEMDRFANLVIYTALRALAVLGSGFWHRYDNGDNLLLRESDFANPSDSALLRELLQASDPQVACLAGRLVLAASDSIERVPLLRDIVTDDEMAVPLDGDERRRLRDIMSKPLHVPTPPAPAAWFAENGSLPEAGSVPTQAASWQNAPPPVRAPAGPVAAQPALQPGLRSSVRQAASTAPRRHRNVHGQPAAVPGWAWALVVMIPLAGLGMLAMLIIYGIMNGNAGGQGSQASINQQPNLQLPPTVSRQPESGFDFPPRPAPRPPTRPDRPPVRYPPVDTPPPTKPRQEDPPPESTPSQTTPANSTSTNKSTAGMLVHTFRHPTSDGSRAARLWSVHFLDSGRKAVSLGEDGSLRFWDLFGMKETRLTNLNRDRQESYRAAAVSPLGDYLVVGGSGVVAEVGLHEFSLNFLTGPVPGGYVSALAYLRSGDPNQRIIIGGNPNTLGRWDANRGLLLREYVNNSSGNVPLVVGPSGTMVLSHTFNNVDTPVHVRASDMRELLRMQPASARITCMAADNPMHNLVAGLSNNLVGHWDVRTGAYRKGYVSNDNVITVALDGQGTRLLVVGDNGIVRIWNIQREEFLGTLMGHDCPVRAAAFAPDSTHVLTGDDRGILRLWRLSK